MILKPTRIHRLKLLGEPSITIGLMESPTRTPGPGAPEVVAGLRRLLFRHANAKKMTIKVTRALALTGKDLPQTPTNVGVQVLEHIARRCNPKVAEPTIDIRLNPLQTP